MTHSMYLQVPSPALLGAAMWVTCEHTFPLRWHGSVAQIVCEHTCPCQSCLQLYHLPMPPFGVIDMPACTHYVPAPPPAGTGPPVHGSASPSTTT